MDFSRQIIGAKWVQWPILIGAISMLALMSVQMRELPFWGHRPLLWLIAFWLMVVGLLYRKVVHSQTNLWRFALSTLSGFLLAVSFPVSPLTPIVFLAWIPLLRLTDDSGKMGTGPYFLYIFNALFLWNILTTYWVLNTSFFPGIVANVFNTILMTVPWLLFRYVKNRFEHRWILLALVAFWISFEYIHMAWEISWPWLSLGNYFAQYPECVQWYSWTGFYGGAIWIWAVNIFLYLNWRKGGISLTTWTKLAGLILIPIATSLAMYVYSSDKGELSEVVIVQPNYDPHYQKFDIPEAIQVKKLMQLAATEVTDSTQFLLFPETVISRVQLSDIGNHAGIRSFSMFTSQHPELNLISGISSYRIYDADSMMNKATRIHVNDHGDTTFWDIQNTALWMKDGQVKEIYFKSKLVPGAEIFPYKDILFFLKPVIDELGGSVAGHYIQDEREVFGPEGMEVGPAICYESVYGAYDAEYIEKGAKAIFIMTNDGWWDDTPGHKQHLAFARLRAIEHRRSIARAANTGISCFINQRGDIFQPTAYNEEAVIKGRIAMNDQVTFYSRWRDYLGQVMLLVSMLYLGFTILRVRNL